MRTYPRLFKSYIDKYHEVRQQALMSRGAAIDSNADPPFDPSVSTVLKNAGLFAMNADG